MDDLSLAHSRYNCTYHIVFIPKYRRKAMFGVLRKEVGEILGKVCKMEEVTTVKAATMPDHVHMYVSIPPKVSISKTIGSDYMKISEPNPNIEHIESLRKQFVTDFDKDTLENLTLEQYAMRTGDKKNFCYRLEREQIGMGDIRNATAQKFGIWVRKTTGEYDFTKKYGETADNAFKVIRSELCKLVDAGAKDDFNAIRRNMIAPIVRFKILAMYYPDRFLTIHSERHLTYFCEKAGIPCMDDDDELVLQRKLLGWKDNHADMRNWSLLEYVAYLYEHFGVPPVVDKGLAKKKPRLKKLKDELKSFDGRHPKTRLTEVEIKERSALVSSIVKERAAGVCQLCNKPAPFFNKNGEAYLECHHIVWLARGGVDEIYNAVALCPNCHRKMHILDIPEDIEYLKNVAKADK